MTEDTVHFDKHSLMVGWNEEEWVAEELGAGSRFWVVGIRFGEERVIVFSTLC